MAMAKRTALESMPSCCPVTPPLRYAVLCLSPRFPRQASRTQFHRLRMQIGLSSHCQKSARLLPGMEIADSSFSVAAESRHAGIRLRQLPFTNPVRVELFTARRVGAFVGVSTKVVALSLKQVGRQSITAITVVVG